MSTRPVGVGFIGAGFITEYHLTGLRAAGGAELRAIAGRTRAKADALAERFGIETVTSDWREVIARDDVDAVVVTTPDDTHPEVAIAAAAAGKHILLQKPMARTVAECQRITAAAQAGGVRLSVSFMHRYFEEVVAARQLLADCVIGTPYAVRMRNATPGPDWGAWFYSRERVGGGVVMQLGVHGIDLLRHLFGNIAAVSADTGLYRKERTLIDGSIVQPDNEDHALALYRFASGAMATHEMSMSELAGCDRFSLEIYGERGTIWLRSLRGALAVFAPGHFGKRDWVVPHLPVMRPGERQHRAFLDLVRGAVLADGTADDGEASIQVAEAIYRSKASRREELVGAAGGHQ